jgi:hypothetical protein
LVKPHSATSDRRHAVETTQMQRADWQVVGAPSAEKPITGIAACCARAGPADASLFGQENPKATDELSLPQLVQ